MKYCPLNIYSGYTFLSSGLKIEDIFKMCDKLDYPFFGICDLKVMFSYSDLSKYQYKYKSKPIFGASFICRFKDFELLLSAYIINEEGYINLVKIISNFPDGIEITSLKSLGKGLICVVPTLSNKDFKYMFENNKIENYIFDLKNLSLCFDDFYLGIEIYNKNNISLATSIRDFSTTHSYKVVAFNKHLYKEKNDAISLLMLDAVKNNTTLSTKEAEGPFFFLKENIINNLYLPNEVQASYDIVNTCKNFVFLKKRGQLLSFPINENKEHYLRNRCLTRLSELHIDNPIYNERLNHEIDIIKNMGYLDYFLLVDDYVHYAKNNNIPVGPGRGSAAGSLVSYLLNITDIDPIKYDLLFERFLNPHRSTMPDIDIDFADYLRDNVANYIFSKYGLDRCANIITFQTFGARAALRDTGRIFSIDNRDINNIVNSLGRSQSLTEAYQSSSAFKDLCKDEHYLSIIKLAKKIEGLPRQAGVHPAGVIINNENLSNTLPIIKNEQGYAISQFEGPLLNDLGYLKMDILSLTNLTIIQNMESYIKKYYDANFSIKNIPLDDSKTYDILNRGLTCGIFQLESSGITKALKEVKTNCYNDIVAILALYRPGPMDNIPVYARNKNNNLKITYLHPSLEKILSSTYGVIIYQEQIMQIVQQIAGFDLGQADLFRRAISKKDASKLASYKEKFISGSLKNNIDIKIANEIFNLIFKFADYGFNKSHTVSYALITYQLAYIKANYPCAFFASTLNHLSFNDPRMNYIKQELSYFNISLVLPSFLKSSKVYTIENNLLYIPFSCIKGINRQQLEIIEEIQKQNIKDFPSFINQANQYHLSDSAIIAMINTGCFDYFNYSRQTLREALPIYREFYQTISLEGELTKSELTALLPLIKPVKEDEITKYDLEYKTLGILLSGTLLEPYKNTISKLGISPIVNQKQKLNIYTTIAVLVDDKRIIVTKKKEQMAILNVQDDSDSIDVVIFPRTYAQYLYILAKEDALLIEGYFREQKDNSINFVAEKIMKLEE